MVENDQGWSYEFHVFWLRRDCCAGLNALPETFTSKNTLLLSPYKVRHLVTLKMFKKDTHVNFYVLQIFFLKNFFLCRTYSMKKCSEVALTVVSKKILKIKSHGFNHMDFTPKTRVLEEISFMPFTLTSYKVNICSIFFNNMLQFSRNGQMQNPKETFENTEQMFYKLKLDK